MTKVFCLSNNPESKIYTLAKESEDFIQRNQTLLLVDAGASLRLHLNPERKMSWAIVESKLLVTGFYAVKAILDEGEILEVNQHNFNKGDFPVRNFTDRLLLKRTKDCRELVRTYESVPDDAGLKKVSWRPSALPVLCTESNRSFFEHLVGKENEVVSINSYSKIKIRIVTNKVVKGSIYNTILYKFNSIGDCEVLTQKAIEELKESDIVFGYSISKNLIKLFPGNNPQSKIDEILKGLELCGQEDFYLKPETKENWEAYVYVEPVLVRK